MVVLGPFENTTPRASFALIWRTVKPLKKPRETFRYHLERSAGLLPPHAFLQILPVLRQDDSDCTPEKDVEQMPPCEAYKIKPT